MKRIGKRIIPLFLALLILVGVPLSSFEEVKATGAEEFLYYTYWDLMSTLYSTCGYDMQVTEEQVKNHGVSGKQAWKNFVTFVDNTAKVHWKLYTDAGSSALKELNNLVNTVTQKGISISQDLYDMLKDVFKYQTLNNNKFDTSSSGSVVNMLTAICGIESGLYTNSGVVQDACNGYALNIVKESDGHYQIFTNKSGYVAKDYVYSSSQKVWVALKYVYNGKEVDTGVKCSAYVSSGKFSSDGAFAYSARAPVTWIIKNGAFVGTDVISAQVSSGACPQEVPDVSPWIKNPSIPDEWRVIHPNETPDPDNNNDGEVLPVVIPIHPTPDKPDKPDGTEEEDSTEKSDNDLSVLINPSTGNQIDPNTGLDIDPDTGYLIDPDTGELIDPKTGKKVDKDKIKNRVKNLPSIVDRAGNITKYFPFCIPWDMMELVKTLKADKKAPRFTFKYTFKEINYTWVVDVNMADYWKYIKIFRWGMTIFFIIGLFFLTTKITTFVHRMSG